MIKSEFIKIKASRRNINNMSNIMYIADNIYDDPLYIDLKKILVINA